MAKKMSAKIYVKIIIIIKPSKKTTTTEEATRVMKKSPTETLQKDLFPNKMPH